MHEAQMEPLVNWAYDSDTQDSCKNLYIRYYYVPIYLILLELLLTWVSVCL